jgi:hypothetical protein
MKRSRFLSALQRRGACRSGPSYRTGRAVTDARNEVWAMDFMSDALFDGQAFRLLTMVDCCWREGLATIEGPEVSSRSRTSAAHAGSTSKRARTQSSRRGCPAAHSPPMLSAFSSMHSPTISAVLSEWSSACPAQDKTLEHLDDGEVQLHTVQIGPLIEEAPGELWAVAHVSGACSVN